MTLAWNELHRQSREYICELAGVNLSVAEKSWEEIDDWLKVCLDSIPLHARGIDLGVI